MERFSRTFREEVLDVFAFSDLEEVRNESTRWLYQYNHDRPHLALDRVPPLDYREQHESRVRCAALSGRGCAPPSDASTAIKPTPKDAVSLYF